MGDGDGLDNRRKMQNARTHCQPTRCTSRARQGWLAPMQSTDARSHCRSLSCDCARAHRIAPLMVAPHSPPSCCIGNEKSTSRHLISTNRKRSGHIRLVSGYTSRGCAGILKR
eukprot:scaffold219897_cov27-Tisochrysis_lutea.AAC.3